MSRKKAKPKKAAKIVSPTTPVQALEITLEENAAELKELWKILKANLSDVQVDQIYALADRLVKQGRNDDALEVLSIASSQFPGDALLSKRICGCHLEMKKYDSAEDACLKALAVNPNDGEAYNLLGIVYAQWQKPARALGEFDKALRCSSPSQDAILNKARLLISLELHTVARKHLFRHCLAILPSSETIQLLAAVSQKCKKWDKYISLLELMEKQSPENCSIQVLKGIVCFHDGKLDLSISAYKKACLIGGGVISKKLLATALAAKKEYEDAALAIIEVINSGGVDACHDYLFLGACLRNMQQHDAAIQALEKAKSSAKYSENIEIAIEISAVYCCQENYDKALSILEEARNLDPDNVLLRVNKAFAILKLGRIDEALSIIQSIPCGQLLKSGADTQSISASLNIFADIYIAAGLLAEAEAVLALATTVDPLYGPTYANLGALAQANADHNKAIALLEKGLAIEPSNAIIKWNLAMSLLATGNYHQGWSLFECRDQLPREYHTRAHACLDSTSCRWQGEPLANKTIILVSEQGLGDTIQFCRFASVLRGQAKKVILSVQEPLIDLLRHSGIADQVIKLELLPSCDADYWCSLMSLPALLNVSPDSCGVSGMLFPYLRYKREQRLQWEERLAGENRPYIGLAWQGNPKAEVITLKGRSMPLSAYEEFTCNFNATYISLQHGFGSEQLSDCGFSQYFSTNQHVVDLEYGFLQRSALISCLDLVITTDTNVAHLAGSLNVPTIVLLHATPDWRWGLLNEATFWYPSLRLVRMAPGESWNSVLGRARDLAVEML